MGAAIIAMEIVALAVGYLAFDAGALLVGAPIIMATLVALVVVRAAEIPRRRLAAQRASRWDPEAVQPGGLMSGFFEAPVVRGDRGVAGR